MAAFSPIVGHKWRGLHTSAHIQEILQHSHQTLFPRRGVGSGDETMSNHLHFVEVEEHTLEIETIRPNVASYGRSILR